MIKDEAQEIAIMLSASIDDHHFIDMVTKEILKAYKNGFQDGARGAHRDIDFGIIFDDDNDNPEGD